MADSYIDKYKGVDRPSVYDILKMVGTTKYKNGEIKNENGESKKYEAVGIDYVIIGGNKFTNYGVYQFIWEKTFVKSPVRSSSGNLGNLNSYATFITPHLIMDFSIMSIEDYRKIMKMHYEANEYTVECYDPIYNQTIKVKMYFGTEEMAKLYTISQNRFLPNGQWEEWVDLVGVTEYKVELIGTNNDLDLVSVRYYVNAPTQTVNGVTTTLTPDFATDSGEEDIYIGEDVLLGSNTTIPQETFASRKKFKNWNTKADGSGLKYLNGYAYTINSNLYLYAQWEDMTEYTLTYNYGLADPTINDLTYEYVTSKPISYGQLIESLPVVEPPKVKYKDIYDGGKEKEKTDVYVSPQWWKVPQKVTKLDEDGNDITEDLIVVAGKTTYWANKDSTIYLLYDVKKYDLTLNLLNPETNILETYQQNLVSNGNGIEYNTPTNLPQLVRTGYTFDGWYYTSDYQSGTKFSGNMPPYSLTLYARWEKNL